MSVTTRPAAVCAQVILLIVSVLVAAAATQAPAHAADQVERHTYHQGVGKSGTIRFYDPNICIRWTVGGVLNYRANHVVRTDDSGAKAHAYAVDRVSLSYNSLTVRGFKPSGSTCTDERKPWSKIELTQQMRGFSCTFSPKISVTTPFKVGASFWPSCGEKTLAHLTDVIDGKASKYTMNHSEEVIEFMGEQSRGFYFEKKSGLTWKCYGINFRVKVSRVGDASDVKSGPRVAACPGWGGSTDGW